MGRITPGRVLAGVASVGGTEVARAVNKDAGNVASTAYTGGVSGVVDKTAGATDGVPNIAGSAVGGFPDPAKAAAAAAANADQEDALNRVKRRAATLLTGGLGDSSAAPVVKKSLLGS